jgi:enediyne biosynthesis protein E4
VRRGAAVLLAATALASLAAARTWAQAPAALPLFRDVTAETGIKFTHEVDADKKFIIESMSGGAAALDFDDDGLLDLYFLNAPTVATAGNPRSAKSVLYRNLGNWKFEDVTDKAGIGYPGWGFGTCTGDYDGDGREDIYVATFGRNKLYHNNGSGSFSDVAEQAGVAVDGWSMGCAFGDYDRDGRLDLFVSRYVDFHLDNMPEFGKGKTCQYAGIAVQCGPRGLPAQSDFLFHNEGNGRFTDVSKAAGVDDAKGSYGLGVSWFDYNEDGWIDLLVCNDAMPNFLYENQKDGTFREVAFPMGIAVNEEGTEQANMGIGLGDYNHDGHLDVWITHFSGDYDTLFRGAGADGFTDVAFKAKIAAVTMPFVNWGTSFIDYDNDTWEDMITVGGHVYPQMDHAGSAASSPYRQRRLVYRNKRDGTFEEIGTQLGPVFTEPRVQRGLLAVDLDNDGRLDLVINAQDGPAQILRNETAGVGHWLQVRLKGKGQNRGAIGALVRAQVGGVTLIRVVRSGSSYLSQEDLRQHFGLGAATEVEWVEVQWPDGSKTRQEHVKGDQLIVIAQP